MAVDPTDLIQFIVWYANTQDLTLTTVRVVKFVYLADLYYARESNGQTLTGFPWAFVHYGPYCSEIMQSLDAAAKNHKIERIPYQSKYTEGDYHVFRSDLEREPSIVTSLSVGVVSNLKQAIHKWGGETPGLLHHVYFETEPMRGARPRSRLDFSKATPRAIPKPIEMRRLSRDETIRARQAVTRLKEKYLRGLSQSQAVDQNSVIDTVYHQTMQSFDEPVIEEPLSGQAKLSVEPEDGE